MWGNIGTMNEKLESSGDSPHYLRLRTDVVKGRWPSGTLLNPGALAQEYGTSRTPVREALHHLEHDGLLTRVPSGFAIPEWTAQDVLGISDARSALEAEAAASAAELRSTLDIATLRHLHRQARDSSDESEARRLNHQWHLVLRTSARSRIFTELLERLDLQLASFDSTVTVASADLGDDLADHAAITDAVENRDAATAQSLMTAHQRRGRLLRIEALAGITPRAVATSVGNVDSGRA